MFWFAGCVALAESSVHMICWKAQQIILCGRGLAKSAPEVCVWSKTSCYYICFPQTVLALRVSCCAVCILICSGPSLSSPSFSVSVSFPSSVSLSFSLSIASCEGEGEGWGSGWGEGAGDVFGREGVHTDVREISRESELV